MGTPTERAIAKLEEQWLCVDNHDLTQDLLKRVNCHNGNDLTLESWDTLTLHARRLYRMGALPRGFDFDKLVELVALIGHIDRLGSIESLRELARLRVSSETEELEKALEHPLPAPGEGVHFRSIDYHLARKPPPYVIDRHVPGESVIMLYGNPGSGKSFVVLDWALRIAAGLKWREHDVQQGNTFYAMLEGAGGFSNRLKAWIHHHEVSPERLSGFMSTTDAIFEKYDPITCGDMILRDMDSRGGAKLFVVDTYSCAIPGKDDVDKKSASVFLSIARRIRDAFGCTIIYIHHTNKGGEVERGNTSLRCDSDMVIKAAKHEKLPYSTLKWEKIRDGEEPKPAKYNLRKVHADGMTKEGSCVVVDSYGETCDRILYSILKKDRGITTDSIANTCEKSVKTIQNSLTKLVKLGLVEQTTRGSWRLA